MTDFKDIVAAQAKNAEAFVLSHWHSFFGGLFIGIIAGFILGKL